MNLFEQLLAERSISLQKAKPNILQLNVGKLCNLTCIHCHVNAGPRRKEIITRETLDKILDWFEASDLSVIDITGGTPEMIPDYRYMIERIRSFEQSRTILNRCNVTILLEEGYEWVAAFLAEHRLEIIASMPCYSPQNVEEQRGHGVFDKSIKALQLLNELGYGRDSQLPLNLVYNPNGPFLPPDQETLELDYKREMKKHFNIDFHALYALTNLPVSRFAKYLKRKGEYEDYLALLREAFNPGTVGGLMCRNMINVSWRGEAFDCDFNQMMNLSLKGESGEKLYLWDIDPIDLEGRSIHTADHCLGCTAGCGSSCGGALIQEKN